jgi:hypothetical protein
MRFLVYLCLFLAFLILAVLLAGCSTTTPGQVDAGSLEWYGSKAEQQVQMVLSACDMIHEEFLTGESPVDCWYQYPTVLVMSFPSAYYHDQHLKQAGKFFQDWCSTVGEATGQFPTFIRIFRREQMKQGLPCRRYLLEEK